MMLVDRLHVSFALIWIRFSYTITKRVKVRQLEHIKTQKKHIGPLWKIPFIVLLLLLYDDMTRVYWANRKKTLARAKVSG